MAQHEGEFAKLNKSEQVFNRHKRFYYGGEMSEGGAFLLGYMLGSMSCGKGGGFEDQKLGGII